MAIETAKYQEQLLTTEQQLAELRRIDKEWGGAIGSAALARVPVDDRPQTLDDMRVLHVEFGSLGETMAKWRDLYLRAGYGFAHWNSMLSRPDEINRYTKLHDLTAGYQPGIHEVHLDLSRGRDEFRTVEDAVATAGRTGELLAQGEVLSLVGLHRATFLNKGGFAWQERPYLPGYIFTDITGEATLQFDSGIYEGEMGLRPDRSFGDFVYGAVPLVIEA